MCLIVAGAALSYAPSRFAEKKLLNSFDNSSTILAKKAFQFDWDMFSISSGEEAKLFARYNCNLISKEDLFKQATSSFSFFETPYSFIFLKNGEVVEEIDYSLRIKFEFVSEPCFRKTTRMLLRYESGKPVITLEEGVRND